MSIPTVIPFPISSVVIGRNRRPAKPDKVAQLADSICEIGLINPITVTTEGALVAGRHRLEACKSLGWEEIPASVVALGILQAELAEIDENLIRNELSELEQGVQLARRKEIHLALYPETGRGKTPGNQYTGQKRETETISFSQDVAKKTGVTERTIRNKTKIGEALTEVAPRLMDTPVADSQKDLLALARMGEDEREEVVQKIESGAAATVKDALRQTREPKPVPVASASKSPRLIVGRAEAMGDIESESVDLIITSPPYNLREDHWPMGGNGRTPRADGIGYDEHDDAMPEEEYQAWQVSVLAELYRVAKPGASLFYNHKVRNRKGQIIHPMDWLRSAGNPWLIRQEIVWDRGSTHNHNPALFWPEDERVYWLTKGAPVLPDRPIGIPSVWRFHGPVIDTWHPAPFAPELPQRCIEAIGRPGIVVLDPFAGSGTTLKVALDYGYDAIGVDLSAEYLANAAMQNGWEQWITERAS